MAEQNGVELGLGSCSTTYLRYVWPDSVQGHFEAFGALVSRWSTQSGWL